jgi:hypothetical protein
MILMKPVVELQFVVSQHHEKKTRHFDFQIVDFLYLSLIIKFLGLLRDLSKQSILLFAPFVQLKSQN